MNLPKLLSVLAAYAAIVSAAHAKDGVIVLSPVIGCQKEANYQWMAQMAVDGSTPAIEGFVRTAYITGECVPLKRGEKVEILAEDRVTVDLTVAVKAPSDGSTSVALVQVKRRGDATTYWTAQNAIAFR